MEVPRPHLSEPSTKGKEPQYFADEDYDSPKGRSVAKLSRTFNNPGVPTTIKEAMEYPTHSK